MRYFLRLLLVISSICVSPLVLAHDARPVAGLAGQLQQ